MRMTSIAIALVATLALPGLALAQTSGGSMGDQSGSANRGDPAGSSNNAGSPAGANTPQGPVTNQGMGGTSGMGGTNGQRVGGAIGGNTMQPGGTNNPQTGTQAPDAQKGGSGNMGAR